MNTFTQFFLPWLIDFHLLATALLFVVLVAMTLMRQPTHKLALIRGCIVGLFLLAGLCLLPGWSLFHITESSVETTPISKAPVTILDNEVMPLDLTAGLELPSPALPAPPQSTENEFALESLEAFIPPTEATVAHETSFQQWPLVFTSLYLLGFLTAVAWLLLGAFRTSQLCRDAEPAPKGIAKLLQTLAGSLTVLPRLLVSGHLSSAVALGVKNPAILLPKVLVKDADPEQISTILAHEWAHVKNGDLRLLAASRLLIPLLWAHPLYWILRVRLRLEQETLADAAAAELTNRYDYAEQLVSWARDLPHWPASAHGFGGGYLGRSLPTPKAYRNSARRTADRATDLLPVAGDGLQD